LKAGRSKKIDAIIKLNEGLRIEAEVFEVKIKELSSEH
jgi:hypothetical protein